MNEKWTDFREIQKYWKEPNANLELKNISLGGGGEGEKKKPKYGT